MRPSVSVSMAAQSLKAMALPSVESHHTAADTTATAATTANTAVSVQS